MVAVIAAVILLAGSTAARGSEALPPGQESCTEKCLGFPISDFQVFVSSLRRKIPHE
jgi:hypothetical protein